MIILKPVEELDAQELFPLVFKSPVLNTILWDGPASLEDLKKGLKEREEQFKKGVGHQFTIIEQKSEKKIGSIDIRPYEEPFRGDMGLWIGVPYHGKGYGPAAIQKILQYGFEKLQMQKVEAKIFVGNTASRKAFEKCGFQLEGTIRRCEMKRGEYIDEWLFGILREECRNL